MGDEQQREAEARSSDRSSATIAAWVLTSSAVVGSSATIRSGSQAIARRSSPAAASRPRAATGSAAGCRRRGRESSSTRSRSSRAPPLTAQHLRELAPDREARVQVGRPGPGRRRPCGSAEARHPGVAGEVGPVEADRPEPRARRQDADAARERLAAAGLADEAERLAARRSSRSTPCTSSRPLRPLATRRSRHLNRTPSAPPAGRAGRRRARSATRRSAR